MSPPDFCSKQKGTFTTLKKEGETDPVTLARRQKQIDYGKATEGYKEYLHHVPKEKRTKWQPQTPNKYQACSRRSWDGQIKIWRLLLHAYDDVGVGSPNTSMNESTINISGDSNNNCWNTSTENNEDRFVN